MADAFQCRNVECRSPILSPSKNFWRVISTAAHFLASSFRAMASLAQTWRTSILRPLRSPSSHFRTMRATLSFDASSLARSLSISRLCSRACWVRSPSRMSCNFLRSTCMLLELKTSVFQEAKQLCRRPRLFPSRNLRTAICVAAERLDLVLAICRKWHHARMVACSRPLRLPFSHLVMIISKSFLMFLWASSIFAQPSWTFRSAFLSSRCRSSRCRLSQSSSALSCVRSCASTMVWCFQVRRQACAMPLTLPSDHCMIAAWMRAAVRRFLCSLAATLRQVRRHWFATPTFSPCAHSSSSSARCASQRSRCVAARSAAWRSSSSKLRRWWARCASHSSWFLENSSW
mmetsp:Transcript_88224/g.249976  ORF Transcript_88224/g.249976 Transcript_88224/m.249976 type:complete len:346 (-) Transcript_88224:511-1548(-)